MVNGNKIRELMQKKGMLNKELAVRVGISESMLSYIILGLRDTTVTTLSRIAKELEVSVDELIVG